MINSKVSHPSVPSVGLMIKCTRLNHSRATAKVLSLSLLSTLLSMQAVAHAEIINHSQQSKNPNEVEQIQPLLTANSVDPQQVAYCSTVELDAARLACFDKVAKGDTVNDKKVPLDLVKTVTTSIQKGKAIPILATEITKTPVTYVDEKDREVLEQVGITKEDVKQYSPLSILYDLDQNDARGILALRPHLPTYVMPVWYSANPNYDIHSPTREHVTASHDQLQNLDTKMQISVKTKLMEDVFGTNADVWFAYTQQSYWQLYNRHSRPFRSSDYQPEIMVTQPIKLSLPLGGDLRLLGAGVVHQSNGQGEALSRSWNRAYLMAGMEWGKFTIVPRLWAIGDSNKDDDNPDIADYMGYGDIRWSYEMNNRNLIGGLFRYNPKTEKGAAQLDYTIPIKGGLRAYVQLFHGYGENIQDYNHKNTNVGVGLMFNEFRGF